MPSQILMFDQPRSAAQLLGRILSKQPNLVIADNAFGPARGAQVEWLMGETWSDGMPEDLRSAFDTGIEKGVATWRSAHQDAQDKKLTEYISILRGESFSFRTTRSPPSPRKRCSTSSTTRRPPRRSCSPTATSPPCSRTTSSSPPGTVPVLTIRDPRLTVPSAYRVLGAMGLAHGSGRPNFLISTSTLWVRRLYEAYRARGFEPVVVDADDLMTGGAGFARRLCGRLGLDPEQACLSWEGPPSAEERAAMHPAYYASQRFLIESSGVDATRAGRNRDLEAEVRGWPEEFGEDVGMIREMVDLAMPNYRYLLERRFQI
ncbi:hypothetical protein PG984_015371 [Apiospora sp. TS-2023a]